MWEQGIGQTFDLELNLCPRHWRRIVGITLQVKIKAQAIPALLPTPTLANMDGNLPKENGV
jgi:hypothetical protein